MRRGLLRSMAGNGFEPEYQAVLDYATTQGYTKPSPSQQVKQNQLMIDLKVAGVFSKLDLLYIDVNDAGYDFATINWIDAVNYQKTGVAWQWTSNVGVALVSGSTSLATSYVPSINAINYALNSASFGYKFGARGGNPIAGSDFPVSGRDTGVLVVFLVRGTNIQTRTNSATSFSFSNATFGDAGGDDVFIVMNRNSATNVQYYKNGVLGTSTTANTSTTVPNEEAIIGANSGQYSNIHELEFVGGSLTGTEVAEFNTAFENYMASL